MFLKYHTKATQIFTKSNSKRLRQSWSSQKCRAWRGTGTSVPSEDHPLRKDISNLQTVQRSVTRMVRDLNAIRTSGRTQRRLPGITEYFRVKDAERFDIQ